jgi:predicted MFS family arabinose efflux permease
MTSSPIHPKFMIALVCAAQVLVQIGAFFWPALLPGMAKLWGLSNSEAGWVTAIFFGAYMIAVPVLVTLTDRVDPKQIYLIGVGLTVLGHVGFGMAADGFWSALLCRAIAGTGWAGTYMTGLKLLADTVDARLMSRATASHAASIGISGALSFICADVLSAAIGWRGAFVAAGVSAGLAWLLMAFAVPWRTPAPRSAGQPALFDFRPVFRNRSAMAYALTYAVHTLEFHALRGWGVAFLAFVATRAGATESWLTPAATLTLLGLVATAASVLGNEAAIRFGRRRLIVSAIVASIACALLLGFVGPSYYLLAAVLVVAYGLAISLDSASLTAGTAGSAEPSRRGATLAVHSMLGYSGGFLGPLIVGGVLDLSAATQNPWGYAYLAVACLSVLSLILFLIMRPRELAGDRGGAAVDRG